MAIISNGTTIADAGAFSASLGSMTHIKTLTASNSATLSFVDGASSVVFDDTYPIYKFEFINIHPANNEVHLQFNMSLDTGSNYNVTKTSSAFRAEHNENDGGTNLTYWSSQELKSGTGFIGLAANIGNDNDQCASGSMLLFNPSNTTFLKHFISRCNLVHNSDITLQHYVAGYGNTTSAIDAIQFKINSGNIGSGQIKMYGIKDS